MAFRSLGQITVRPTDDEITVGAITVPAFGGVEVRVKQISPSQGFRFAYGLVSYVSSFGNREIGTVKVWAGADPADYRLGSGLACTETTGSLTFDPRSYNLRWIKAGFPWTLEIWVDETPNNGAGTGPGTYAGGFVTTTGAGLTLARVVFP